MRSLRGLRRAAVLACLLSLIGDPLGAAADTHRFDSGRFGTNVADSGSGSAAGKVGATSGATQLMPGARFRRRSPLVLNSVSALGAIMRTENVRDPQYLALRRIVSDDVASRMGLDADTLDKAWSKAPRDHQIAVLAALTQMGVRYVVGKEDPYTQMDCSGLLWYAWRIAGVDMPRQAVSQLDKRMRIEPDDALAGDVVGYGTHVHIYLGVEAAMVHAPFSGKQVKLKHMPPEQLAISAWANPSNIATYRL